MTEQVANPEEKQTTEKVEVTSKESKDTTLDITKTEEFRKAQSGWDKQIALAKAEAQKHQAESEKLRKAQERMDLVYKKLEADYEKRIGDQDPEALEGYRRAKSQAAWEAERERREAELAVEKFEVDQTRESTRLALRAVEIAQEYGVPVAELKTCTNEREMELTAKLHQKPKEPETPKVDSAVSSAGSAQVPQSAKGKIKAGWDELHKPK